jgi:hypothetical protein
MKKNSLILLAAVVLGVTLVTLKTSYAEENKLEVSQANEGKSIAWYTANIQEAKAQNQLCHNVPAIKDSEDCKNSLRALEISFGVQH